MWTRSSQGCRPSVAQPFSPQTAGENGQNQCIRTPNETITRNRTATGKDVSMAGWDGRRASRLGAGPRLTADDRPRTRRSPLDRPGATRVELDAHPDLAVAPRDASRRLRCPRRRPGRRNLSWTLGARGERVHRPDRQAALADVERDARRRSSDPARYDTGTPSAIAQARAAVEVVGKQVRRERRENLRRRGVLVDVAADAERQERRHLRCATTRAGKDHDRQRPRPASCLSSAHERHAVARPGPDRRAPG